MNRRAPLRITMLSREVVAARGAFARRGDEFHDADVARDEVSTLRPRVEPLVLRVEVRGGAAKDRRDLAGDWLCEADGSAPRALPAPPWSPRHHSGAWLYSNQSEAWAKKRTMLDAWEWCPDPRWLLHTAGMVGVDLRVVALAACACARSAMRSVAMESSVPLRAIGAVESWARGGISVAALRAVSVQAREAAYSTVAVNDDVFAHVADAAHAATRMALDADVHQRADHPYANAPSYGAAEVAEAAANAVVSAAERRSRLLGGALVQIDPLRRSRVLEESAILVRKHVPTIAVLRASIV